ncbi:MAG: SMC-Scp complex subunit ScpB [Parachlamydiales bacterium]|jgi:segregation and condensation protein B
MAREFNLFDLLERETSPPPETPSLPSHKLFKQIVEGLFFSSSEPLSFQKLREIIAEFHPITPATLRHILMELALEYEKQERAFALIEIANGFILRTRSHLNGYIDVLMRDRRSERLSQAAAEVLAIIAYKQPITRPQMEAIRGVDCSGVIQTLLERNLICAAGKLEAPGRPTLFETTKEFLQHYGLRDVKDLPSMSLMDN